jgi:prephenate dehydrogenase
MMLFDTLTIVGVGLIGGSIGLAARERALCGKVIGVGRNVEALQRSKEAGILTEWRENWDEAFQASDLIVFCTPVDQIIPQAQRAIEVSKPNTIITDAGSTKAKIVQKLQGNNDHGIEFLGSHPLAGSEKKGADFARATLFEQRVTIITPTSSTTSFAKERVKKFWQGIGSQVVELSAEEHDTALAYTSHLPHLLASALAGMLPAEWQKFTASGFRDTTRIAAGDAALWTAIFQENREALLAATQRFQLQLQELCQAIQSEDSNKLLSMLHQAKQVRDALGN